MRADIIAARSRAAAATPNGVRKTLAQAMGFDRGRSEDREGRGRPVGVSDDLKRILALPRRKEFDFESEESKTLARIYSDRLRAHPNATLGGKLAALRPVQAVALSELAGCRGLVGAIGVGHGKELLSILAPMVLPECRIAVLLIPSEARDQFYLNDWPRYSAAFKCPNLVRGNGGGLSRDPFYTDRPALHVVTYGELHHKNHAEDLEKLAPDFIIANEAQAFADRGTTQTKRLIRYFANHPATRFMAVSGTFTKRSIKDFAHLMMLALRQGAPVPLEWHTVEEWAQAIDDRASLAPAGKLIQMCEPGESVRVAFGRRMRETPGFISTPGASTDVPLRFEGRDVDHIPEVVRAAMQEVEESGTRPDGYEFIQQTEVAKCLQELACGFYYQWVYPRGESISQINEWKATRKQWNRELRGRLAAGGHLMDSPLLCINAADRFEQGYSGPLPVWQSKWLKRWREIEPTVQPETEAVWISDFLIEDAIQWGRENIGIIWAQHVAFAERLAQKSGFMYYGGGKKNSRGIRAEKGDRTVIASITAHHFAKNLQMFNKQLVANPPADGGRWEQLLGRTHRQGQTAEEVLCVYYEHVDAVARRMLKAESLATFIQELTKQPQRLLTKTRALG